MIAQLRRRRGRAVALLIGMLVATTGFTVLTSESAAERLQVTSTVSANARSVYDILVRPKGSQTSVETRSGLVTPDFLSGQFGGITLDQWHQIQAISGIDVAAPVAMIGYVYVQADFRIDVTSAINRSKATQVLRLDRTWMADHGSTSLPDPAAQYVYVTTRPIAWPRGDPDDPTWSDGKKRRNSSRCTTSDDPEFIANPIEIEPDGSERVLCEQHELDKNSDKSASMMIARILPDGTFETGDQSSTKTLTVDERWPIPMLLAAVDPASEAQLVSLDRALTSGSYLSEADVKPDDSDGIVRYTVPVLATDQPALDEQLVVDVEALHVPDGADVATAGWDSPEAHVPAVLSAAPATRVSQQTLTADQEYINTIANPPFGAGQLAFMSGVAFAQPSPATFATNLDGSLRPQPAPPTDPDQLNFGQTQGSGLPVLPPLFGDTAFRALTPYVPGGDVSSPSIVSIVKAGTFNPSKIEKSASLGAASLETYQQPSLVGADAASKAALGGTQLQADGNTTGYVATPPALITSLGSLSQFRLPKPISAIRVRVDGATSADPLSRERVRIAAQRIEEATGLDVDITLGSSASPQTIDLAAGRYGRPALKLTEGWTRKGAALAIVSALDRKSLVLFVLILVVCMLFLGNAVAAVVRSRRRELAILAYLGWPRRRLVGLILGEVGLIGLIAGAVSAAAAISIAHLANISLTSGHALLAVPVSLGLALIAAAAPAWRAGRVRATTALSTSVRAPRRAIRNRRRTVAGIALANLRRSPGRTLLGALALAIGTAAVTVLTSIDRVFHDLVTGTLLGDAVSLQVRGVDLVAVLATVILGLVAVADMLYLSIQERSEEFAALRAIGWSDAAVGRLVAYEGVGIGVLGVAMGVAAGLVSTATFAGESVAGLIGIGIEVALCGVVLTAVAATVPAFLQRYLSVSAQLAEE
ncbi:MAG TPA: ABC transporter permease [Micromonosporaceae bacterium]